MLRTSFRQAGLRLALVLAVGGVPLQAQADPAPADTEPRVVAPEPVPIEPPAPMAPPPPVDLRERAVRVAPATPPRRHELVHGLGAAASFSYGSGFAYRRYFGVDSIQINGFGWVANRGDDALVFGGIAYAHRLFAWSSSSTSRLMPATSGMRLIAAATYYQRRQKVTNSISDCTQLQGCTFIDTQHFEAERLLGFGVGFGFEFGALQQPGFSVALDLLLTGAYSFGVPESERTADSKPGVQFILPLPAGSLIYSW